MYRSKLYFLTLFVALVLRTAAQARVDATGRPVLIMDDSFAYTTATLIYKSAEEEFYVPDLTRTDWVRSRYQQLATSGAFTVYVYAYHVGNGGLRGQRADISLEKKTASIYDFTSPKTPPKVFLLTSSKSPLISAINLKIIPLVKREMLDYHRSLFGPPPDRIGSYSPATN